MSRNQTGFTVVELMAATLVFSVILIVITSGVIHFTQDYYKGVHQSATQTTARDVMNTIAQNLEYGGGMGTYGTGGSGDDQALCIGSIQIDYALGRQLGTDTNYGVFVGPKPAAGSCNVYSGGSGHELLAPKMRLTNLTVVPREIGGGDANAQLYDVNVGIAYGDIDLLCSQDIAVDQPGGCGSNATPFASYADAVSAWNSDPSHPARPACRSGAGSQFCAFSELSTQIVSRFSQ